MILDYKTSLNISSIRKGDIIIDNSEDSYMLIMTAQGYYTLVDLNDLICMIETENIEDMINEIEDTLDVVRIIKNGNIRIMEVQ